MNSLSADEDVDLVRKILAGDENSYRQILRKYERRIYSICYRILCNEAAAEDAAQDAFIRAYFALKRYDQNRPFLPWLIRIAVNRAISVAERERVYEPLPQGFLETAGEDGTSDTASQGRELERAARDAVAGLPPKLRAVVALRVFEELSYGEIAETLRLSIGTVMSRLSRGRNQIKSKLVKFL